MEKITEKTILELQSVVNLMRDMRLSKKEGWTDGYPLGEVVALFVSDCEASDRCPPSQPVFYIPEKETKHSGFSDKLMRYYASAFQSAKLFSNDFDESDMLVFFSGVMKFLSLLISDSELATCSPMLTCKSKFAHVLNLIVQVCPTQQMLFHEYVKMSMPYCSLTAEQYLLTVLRCSKEQRDCLNLFNEDSVAESSAFVTVMSQILDIQDRLIRGLLARIKGAITT
jgi:hypothetical protein